MNPFDIAGFRLSAHAEAVIKERELEMRWIEATLNDPETTTLGEDGNMDYIKHLILLEGGFKPALRAD